MEDELTAAKAKQTAANTANDSAQKRLVKINQKMIQVQKLSKRQQIELIKALPDQTPAATTRTEIYYKIIIGFVNLIRQRCTRSIKC